MAEPDTKELDALLTSLNGSAERFQTLWFSFLGLTLYLAISARGTTHLDLLLNNPQVLPILNVKVDLLLFYIIAPLLYFVFHFYVLMMLVLLAGTAAPFEQQLRMTLPDEADRELYRARAENALFLQLLIGMKDERAGINSDLLTLISIITIVLAPLATLILIQMMFLPYHSFGITWWHRALVLGDLVLMVLMRLRYAAHIGVGQPIFAFSAENRSGLAVAASIGMTAGVIWLTLWEGRWAGEPYIGRDDLAESAGGVLFGLFPDRLILPDKAIVGEKILEETKKEIASRAGDFVPTIPLDDRDLQAAELTGADLRGVSLKGANLRRANLREARLDGANLSQADLWRATLYLARLQGAVLFKANLISSGLVGGEFANVDFSAAVLESPNFLNADLKGADLHGQLLIGADFQSADLRGANLQNALLQGADLRGAHLQGGDLRNTRMSGVDMRWAQLQGADFSGADLSEGEIDSASLFRADIATANLATTYVRSVNLQSPSPTEVESWIAEASRFAPERDKIDIAKRFARLSPEFQDTAQETTWMGMAESSLALDANGAHHRRRLAGLLASLACEPNIGPHIARRYILEERDRLISLGDQIDALRDHLEEERRLPGKCPGVDSFDEGDWGQLRQLEQVVRFLPIVNMLWRCPLFQRLNSRQ